MNVPFPKIHIVVNPASGKDEPILNTINDVFHQYGVNWSVSVTRKYGDAEEQAIAAIAAGADLVAGYGGDGTQHEIANAIMNAAVQTGRRVPMGVLPGGTGNGFAREMNIPRTLRPAVELLCTSQNLRHIDVAHLSDLGQAHVSDEYFIQRLYVGIEPEQQTSRAMKDKYGVFAYAVSMRRQKNSLATARYQAVVDGVETVEFEANKVYVVNSGMMGTGFAISHTYAIDDGLLDAFVLNKEARETLTAAVDHFLDRNTPASKKYYRQCRQLSLNTDPDQPIWADGEYIGRTPVTIRVLPGALAVVVPAL
ncbi:MAG: diacylglycerol kinase family lipid kinase [Anaerolineae bacterium]